MGDCIITMRSATLAKKAERALRRASIPALLVSVDPSVTKRGCGYGLSLQCRDTTEALDILDERNITHGEVLGRSM